MFLKIQKRLLENTCAGITFLIKLLKLSLCKKEVPAHVFFCEFWNFLRTPILEIIFERLLLKIGDILFFHKFMSPKKVL